MRHSLAYGDNGNPHSALIGGGEYQWRREGPPHLFNPETVFLLQHATRSKRLDIFKKYAQSVDSQSISLKTIRGLFVFSSRRKPININEVEPISSIISRFATGAMSYGAISKEMHETLAVAANRIGAKSNTGEGGESVERLTDPKKSSAIKQVASGRFGVTSLYLSNASDLQIKLAQGAKPGEGGQLPANKVYPDIARNRMGTPGVGLISPPPHHDIYSIEDLKQLIFDLKRANREARINVKLVSEAGVGTVAAGVAKAKADVILISGHDGGTGASPLSSLKHAGTPWEIGLAEAHQTLVANGLRNRVVLQADGHIMTGRDVLIAALLGAEEFGFATAPMVVSGCVLMRVCHLDTCPVGVATQNPELRKRFTGTPEFVETYLEFVAIQVRELLAELGFKSLGEIIGRSELLAVDEKHHNWKSVQLDLDAVLRGTPEGIALGSESQNHELTSQIDFQFLEQANQTLESGKPVKINATIRNTDRAIGTLLGNEVTKRFNDAGLPDDSIQIVLEGSAGQSLGAFIPRGITIRLSGDANDFVGKGISGGRIVLNQPAGAEFRSDRNIVAGNVVGYGATGGEIFISGLVGERFCVRNSGATVVAEGTGDHALEYMTGGVAVILGDTGKNLAAGMSGGIAFIRNLDPERLNKESRNADHLTVSTPSGENADLLKSVLERFAAETGSVLTKEILSDWQNALGTFSLLLPTKYAAVKAVLRNADENNTDVETEAVWQQILEVTGG
jgi:glutamate synthase (NADPH/NADH) large chain